MAARGVLHGFDAGGCGRATKTFTCPTGLGSSVLGLAAGHFVPYLPILTFSCCAPLLNCPFQVVVLKAARFSGHT